MFRPIDSDAGDSRSMMVAPGTQKAVFWRLLPYLRPYARTITLGLVLLLFSIPASNFHPLVWAYIVDEVITRRHVAMLLPAIAAMFTVQAIGTILGAWRANLLEKVGQCLVFSLRNETYAKLQRQSLAYHHEHRIGDLVARTMGDIDQLQEVAVQGTDSLIANG
ncbi:MAG: ABC transporter transmembrane domain-containing protein, partial [Armatimonadota bacterium]|nr:ABC transporter transmembrane domain-containing protein [Armatimonadota bacterium]